MAGDFDYSKRVSGQVTCGQFVFSENIYLTKLMAVSLDKPCSLCVCLLLATSLGFYTPFPPAPHFSLFNSKNKSSEQ